MLRLSCCPAAMTIRTAIAGVREGRRDTRRVVPRAEAASRGARVAAPARVMVTTAARQAEARKTPPGEHEMKAPPPGEHEMKAPPPGEHEMKAPPVEREVKARLAEPTEWVATTPAAAVKLGPPIRAPESAAPMAPSVTPRQA